ncbi:tetratricopeptide repeat protein [Thermodesulfobacteriota bacterium]
MAYISFAVNYYLEKYDPAGYRIVNILIHLVNGILVFFLARLTCQQVPLAQRAPTPGSSEAPFPALPLFAALVFIAHPIQVQSVTYIVQRMTGMATMFYLLSMLLYIYGRLRRTGQRRRMFFAGCFASWILALGSKEIAAMLPFTLFLYEWYFFQDLSKNWLRRRIKYLPILILLFGLIAVVFLGQHPLDSIERSFANRDFNLWERVLTQFRVVVTYLGLLIFPVPARLNLLHHIPVSHSLFEPLTTLLSLLLLGFLLGLAVRLAEKERVLSFCILWFFLHLVIESSVVGLELMFEHRLYLPMFGFSLAAAHLLFFRRPAPRKWVSISAVLIVASLGVATHARNKTWQDTITLWSDVISKNPQSNRAHYNLGSDLARKGRLDEAVHHFYEALRIKPDYGKAHNNLGLVLYRQGKLQPAVHHFSEALRLLPDNAAAHYNMGLTLTAKGDSEAAVGHYSTALRIKPDFAEVHNSLGILLERQGRFEEAVHHYSAALNINPDFAAAHHNMGSAYEKLGRDKEAVDHYFMSLRIRPDDAKTYNNLGVALTRQGILEQAVRCYEEALRIDPDDAGVHNNLGVVLARQGKREAAIEHYLEALRLRPYYTEAHGNLGVELMKEGRFSEAVYHFSEALRIRPGDAGMRNNLELALRQMEKPEEKQGGGGNR